jgi:hypothetical protein
MLHFKFMRGLGVKSTRESDREEHWNSGEEYKLYKRMLDVTPSLALSSKSSRRYHSSDDLIKCGVINRIDHDVKT